MVVRLNLSAEWAKEASEGRLSAPFVAEDGRHGKWGVFFSDGVLDFFFQDENTTAQHRADIEERELGPGLSIVYHPFRAWRIGARTLHPGRQPDLPFDPQTCSFSCQNPQDPRSLLARRPLAQFIGPHGSWHAYPNAAPLTPDGHVLWIPLAQHTATLLPHIRQQLSLEHLADFMALARAALNFFLFFNSLHAGATTNHLHFQAVAHTHPLAIELATHEPLGPHAVLGYAAPGLVFDLETPSSLVWSYIDRLQRSDIPYNLIATGQCVYLFPRDVDYEVVEAFPGGVLASMEIAGRLITGNRGVYERTTATSLAEALSRATLSKPAILDLFGQR